MSRLKYWDADRGRWTPVAGMTAAPTVLQTVGGTVSGDLSVTGDLRVDSKVKTGRVTGLRPDSVFEGNIRLRGREVHLGGARMTAVADPVEDNDAVNLGFVRRAVFDTPAHMGLDPFNGWTQAGEGRGPLTLHQAPDGLVRLSGAAVTTQVMEPGSGALLAVLPQALTIGVRICPVGRRVFLVTGTLPHFLHRVDVESNGEVLLRTGPQELPVGYRVSLEGIAYYPTS